MSIYSSYGALETLNTKYYENKFAWSTFSVQAINKRAVPRTCYKMFLNAQHNANEREIKNNEKANRYEKTFVDLVGKLTYESILLL